MNPEGLVCLASARGVNLDAISRGGEPEWTAQDLGIALAGLDQFKAWCALYSWAGDDSVRGSVKIRLMEALLREREERQWAGKVERIYGMRTNFSEELTELFLAEERRPQIVRDVPLIRAIWMQVEPEVWRKTLSHQYAYLGAVFAGALADAEYHIRRKLRGRV